MRKGRFTDERMAKILRAAMRSPAVAGPRFPCPLASESHQRTTYGGT